MSFGRRDNGCLSSQYQEDDMICLDSLSFASCKTFDSVCGNDKSRVNQSATKRRLKYSKSPFRVDLVAENERIDEENLVRLKERSRQRQRIERRKEDAKNAIIIKALEESNQLEDLRKEKRKILEEEKRLKALIRLEKTNATRKQDRIIAERAERKRRHDKKVQRRNKVVQLLDKSKDARINLLKIKHDIKEPPDNTFTSFGN